MANKKISNEELEWLRKHKQSVEKRSRVLKRVSIFSLYSALAFTVFSIIFAILSLIVALVTLPGVVIFAVVFSIALSSNLASIASRYEEEALIGIFSGVIIGLIFALL